MGRSVVMRMPIVRTMRQPPMSVPRPMAAWHRSTIQNGTSSVLRDPVEYRSTTMTPIVF